MRTKKYLLGVLSTILSVGFLFGCNDKKDEAEPDPTEEPSEQRAQNARNNNDLRDVGYQPDRDRNDNVDNNQTRLKVADEAADRIAKLDEVDNANVIVTNRNAYVAVVLKNEANGEVTDPLKEKISDQVRATDRDIRNVYVSSDPDFVNRMEGYGNRINEDATRNGLFEDFTETVRRVFPNTR
ncbi:MULTISPECIES: YhcN/YlaJ family sporulation lipoprotein [Priestia]|jgi:YhcN/YlaJ family sporulation lipoprotein|uniref:Lipoprotein YhcN (Precursor) n=2 Tax=Priestia TaxID=2800373 RepID=D5DPN8_PRIM1|nr:MULTISPECIES: YhcN/YlaJ family sporulation lipoprotein [Priestia]KOP74160.1 sporulation protein [Bacillus sp. FJAT-21351]MDH6655091.1 YhcN/YlaJ family sporulation lipoprotein [Bacillus sp. PvP124]ADE68959.1 lipoprotein YhcN (precursor) [Priestia megaterium QM B1551]MBA9038745.1 YhcN/YlaJ family sporulation lipoprotein [Priestia aryabhattai]MBG9930935.1 sporulation protein [Priestia aryabhattai]